jgi:hypothetical protein
VYHARIRGVVLFQQASLALDSYNSRIYDVVASWNEGDRVRLYLMPHFGKQIFGVQSVYIQCSVTAVDRANVTPVQMCWSAVSLPSILTTSINVSKHCSGIDFFPGISLYICNSHHCALPVSKVVRLIVNKIPTSDLVGDHERMYKASRTAFTEKGRKGFNA